MRKSILRDLLILLGIFGLIWLVSSLFTYPEDPQLLSIGKEEKMGDPEFIILCGDCTAQCLEHPEIEVKEQKKKPIDPSKRLKPLDPSKKGSSVSTEYPPEGSERLSKGKTKPTPTLPMDKRVSGAGIDSQVKEKT